MPENHNQPEPEEVKPVAFREAETEADLQRTDFDGTWKGAILKLTEDMIFRFVPDLYERMDPTQKIEFLNTEFLHFEQPSESASFVDSLMRVPMKDGSFEFVLLHIEVQGSGTVATASDRMFEYCLQIRERYGHIPIGLLIMTPPTEKSENRMVTVSRRLLKAGLSYTFYCVNLNNLNEDELRDSDRPGDVLVYAIKRTVRINYEDQKRRHRKHPEKDPDGTHLKAMVLEELLHILDERNWGKEQKHIVMQLALRVLNLPKLVRNQVIDDFEKEAREMEEMDYIFVDFDKEYKEKALAEGLAKGEAKGLAKGKLEATVEMIRKLLVRGFSLNDVADISGMPLDFIQNMQQGLSS